MLKKRWCSTLWPTEALAQQAGMASTAFERSSRARCSSTAPDPVAAWGELRAFQDRLIARLTPARELRIEAEGTDLRCAWAGGRGSTPTGSATCPAARSSPGRTRRAPTGSVFFDMPSSPARGRRRRGDARLRDGEVVEASAQRGEAYLRQALATDDGARRLGELGLGTNYGIDRPIGTILFDEKIGGTVHLALGRSYPETGGKNVSAVHWDLICDLRARRPGDRRRRGHRPGRALLDAGLTPGGPC